MSKGPIVRQEITQPLTEGSITALLAAEGPVAERTRAVAGSAPLQALFTVRTHRDVFQALRGEVDAAEIVLDDTEVRPADADAPPDARSVLVLRRVEVELHDALTETLQPLIVELCHAVVLAPAKLSKFAVGMAASGRTLPDRATPPQLLVDAEMSALKVGQALLRRHLDSWREIEPAVRLGEDAEALHQLRVTGRKIIAVLRLLETVRLGGALSLRRRVQTLLRRTGTLRDLDVQRTELDAINAALSQRELEPLVHRAGRLRLQRQRSLVALLESPRVRQLLTALHALTTAASARAARIPIATAASAQISRRYRRVRRQARLLGDPPSIEQCHQLRLECKKLRYLAEPFDAFYGEPMQRFLRRLRRLQSLLGRINDSRHAIESLERQIAQRRRLPASSLFAMGRVAEQQQGRMDEARDAVRRAWRRVSGKTWRRLRQRLHERVTQSKPAGRLRD